MPAYKTGGIVCFYTCGVGSRLKIGTFNKTAINTLF